MFATSRTINVYEDGGDIYGLNPETAWNFGFSYLQGFNLFGKEADITLDYYRTDFENQIVIDYENSYEVNIYNLDGKSFANSFQAEFFYNILKQVDLKMAYKFYDVQTDYSSGRKSQPLTPKHRLFANVSYETNLKSNGSQWKIDATYNWLSKQRFSDTSLSLSEYQLPEYSPTVATLNAQITKVFSPKFELYLGGENITNVRQSNPIVSADNPFSTNFDTTFVYGPIFGSNYYAGLRFKIK